MKTSFLTFSIFHILLLNIQGSTNFVKNGGFQDTSLANSFQGALFWTGNYELVLAGTLNEFTTTQSIDLAPQSNGLAEQEILLPFDGIYQLSFVAKDRAINLQTSNESIAQVYWDEVMVLICHPQPMQTVAENVNITGKAGLNYLKFVEVGTNNGRGLLVDNVSIYLKQPLSEEELQQLNEQQNSAGEKFIQIASTVVSAAPLNQLKLAYICFFIEDISLYSYANREYSSKVNDILNFFIAIQTTQKSFLFIILNISTNLKLPASDYSIYSNQKHLRIDDNDDLLFRNIYPFLVSYIPQTIMLILILKLIFHTFQKYRISLLFRRFSFFSCVLLQSCFEGSGSYFTYLTCNQFKILFSFTIVDKVLLAFAAVFFWACLTHSFCFYFVINYFYQKKAGYFLYCYYRSLSGLSFVSIRVGVRSLIRGIVFSFYQQQYFTQCLLLINIELILIAAEIILQLKYEIFVHESKFCLQILHHSLLIGMTAFLLLQKLNETKIDSSLKLLIESGTLICIYGMGTISILDFLVELISHKRVYSEQYLELDRFSAENRKKLSKLYRSAYLSSQNFN